LVSFEDWALVEVAEDVDGELEAVDVLLVWIGFHKTKASFFIDTNDTTKIHCHTMTDATLKETMTWAKMDRCWI
jgi:hypothetical protein